MDKNLIKVSKFLSLVLRHDPGKIGIVLDDAGWTGIDGLLSAMRRHDGAPTADRATLERVVETNDKGRFEISEDGRRIRARQGHSVSVDLKDEQREPPEWLYHGTAWKFANSIRSGGLRKMSRHAVHLSPDDETARKVGSRHGSPAVLMVRAKAMHDDGHAFFLTGNGVWYTDHVPFDYIVWPG